jgi:type IV secretory pathway VirJ component
MANSWHSADVKQQRHRWSSRAALVGWMLWCFAASGAAQTTATINLRGHQQTLNLYGDRAGTPVVVSSGDGGWIHLGPHVAQTLATHGFFAVGFDVKAYLAGFTTKTGVLNAADEAADYRQLIAFAVKGSSAKPFLIGVSEGAGLSVLAATDPATKASIVGVVGLGLPDVNELGWRWKDSIIYLTHGNPKEPTFSVAAIIDRVAPLPLAAIHSSHDEFVPVPEIQRVMAAAHEPKRLWVIQAADHRFSDNLPTLDSRLLEAIEWIRSVAGAGR